MSEFNWVARGRHVTHSVSPCRILSLSPSDGSKNLLPPLICPPAIPCSNPRHFCDEPRGPTMISPLRVGPPTRRGGSSPGCASLIFDREVLRAPTCCADSSRTVAIPLSARRSFSAPRRATRHTPLSAPVRRSCFKRHMGPTTWVRTHRCAPRAAPRSGCRDIS